MSPACLRSLRDVQKAGKAEGGAKQSPAHGSFYLGFPERRTFVFVGCFGQATRTKEAEEPAAEENSAVPLASKRPAGQGSKSPPPRFEASFGASCQSFGAGPSEAEAEWCHQLDDW